MCKKILTLSVLSTALLTPIAFCSEYFSNLKVSDAVNVKDAGDLAGIGPHLVEIKGAHNITLRAHYFKADHPKALVLGVHGLQSNGRWFLKSGTFLAQNGISALFYDRRGSGLSDGDPSKNNLDPDELVDPNSTSIKVAPGLRGHVDTGFILGRFLGDPSHEFFQDIKSAFDKLIDLNRLYKKDDGSDLDIYVYANCFGSRIAIPFAQGRNLFQKHVRGLIVTAPATDMAPRADITNPMEKISIALPAPLVIGQYGYTKTPLQDSYFISPSHPAYSEIQNDKLSLSLRFVSKDFLFAANRLDQKLMNAVPKAKIPLLIILGNKDKIVESNKIAARFKRDYKGPGKILTFNSEHMIEFGESSQGFLESVKRWIELDQKSSNPTQMSTQGLSQLISVDNLPATKAAAACPCDNCACPKK